jgi:hypothetical protein
VANPNASNSGAWNASITKVEDNKAYVGETGDTFFANVQTERIKNGERMFYNCTNLTAFTSDLSSLTKGYYMFYNCTNLTTFSSDLSSLTDVNNMFYYCTNLTTFSSDLSSLTNGHGLFQRCSNLTSFTSDLPSLTNGERMFYFCSNLTTFISDLSSLTNGRYMFNYCSNLTSFTSDLSSLTNAGNMFSNCKNLTTFSSDLSSLTLGASMFMDCANLTSFTSDLPNLTEGGYMFNNCSKLTSFTSDLSSLVDGDNMFRQCKLDAKSVMYIADTINDIAAEKQLYIDGTIPYVTKSNGVYSATKGFMSDGKYVYTYNNPQHFTYIISAANVGKLALGINVTNDTTTIQQQLEDFAKEATFDSWEDLKQAFVNKGWTVTFLYGGTATEIILPEDE